MYDMLACRYMTLGPEKPFAPNIIIFIDASGLAAVQIKLRGESIMKRKTLRVFATAMVLSLTAGLFAGCGSGNNQGNSGSSQGGGTAESTASAGGSGDVSGKDTLVIVTANETPSVTTNLHNAVAGDYLNRMTHNCLFYMDEDMAVQPDLVESYENPSDTEWVFKLKQGVKFHNGEELKAADVKASLELCKTSPEVS